MCSLRTKYLRSCGQKSLDLQVWSTGCDLLMIDSNAFLNTTPTRHGAPRARKVCEEDYNEVNLLMLTTLAAFPSLGF